MKPAPIILFDTFGWIAIASLLVCGVTGVFLVIPYDPVKAYLSVTTFVTFNPAASFARNLHYWSAQFFLIFTALHFIDRFRMAETIRYSGGEPKRILRKGTWALLVFSIMVVLYVMLSGFILKDDADSRQAHLIFSSLLSSIPFIGKPLSIAIIGSGESLITLYLHHAATATIIIFIVVFQHVHSIRVKWTTFIVTSLIIILLSLVFRAPLSMQDEAIMKGPWFFVGIQEMLHLVTQPVIVMSILCLFLLLIFFTPFAPQNTIRAFKITILIAGVIYFGLSLFGYFFRGTAYTFQSPWNDKYITPITLARNSPDIQTSTNLPIVVIAGGAEGCMSCHKGMTGLSEAHNPDLTGCYSCHGGDPFTLNAKAAHRDMYKVPGNLSNASATCGGTGCHDDITQRVEGSLMAGLGGMIAVDKWVFGESATPQGYFHVSELKDSPSDIHLKNLCAGCHLGMEKSTYGNAKWLDRGGGCNACHLTYDKNALASLDEITNLKQKQQVSTIYGISSESIKIRSLSHPSLNLTITNDKCESCHSRSGRISMSYAGWHETDLKSIPAVTRVGQYRQLADKRIFIKQSTDVHHEAGMLCIDCHGSYELMGNGKHHMHKEDAVKVQCKDCHPLSDTSKEASEDWLLSSRISETDRETQLISWLRKWNNDNPQVILTLKERVPLVNTRVINNPNTQSRVSTVDPSITSQKTFAYLLRKSDNKALPMRAASKQCNKGKAHKRLDCEACHTAWVPQCLGCHNTYETKTMGYDLTANKERKGTWVEYSGVELAELPVLGIKDAGKNHDQQRVGIFTPGMIMTIDQGKTETFHRLFAPVSGHTTRKEVRSCESCHLNSLALGYGRGKLTLVKDGKWVFAPAYALSKYDNLPEDTWIGFLSERKSNSSTRLTTRPFNINEQKRILQVGTCLTCHKDGTKVIELCLYDFDKALQKRSKRCFY